MGASAAGTPSVLTLLPHACATRLSSRTYLPHRIRGDTEVVNEYQRGARILFVAIGVVLALLLVVIVYRSYVSFANQIS